MFELAKVETVAVRKRMLGHLLNIDEELGARRRAALGMEGRCRPTSRRRSEPIDMKPSPALQLGREGRAHPKGRKVAALVTDGADEGLLARCAARWRSRAPSFSTAVRSRAIRMSSKPSVTSAATLRPLRVGSAFPTGSAPARGRGRSARAPA